MGGSSGASKGRERMENEMRSFGHTPGIYFFTLGKIIKIMFLTSVSFQKETSRQSVTSIHGCLKDIKPFLTLP